MTWVRNSITVLPGAWEVLYLRCASLCPCNVTLTACPWRELSKVWKVKNNICIVFCESLLKNITKDRVHKLWRAARKHIQHSSKFRKTEETWAVYSPEVGPFHFFQLITWGDQGPTEHRLSHLTKLLLTPQWLGTRSGCFIPLHEEQGWWDILICLGIP